MPDDDASLTDQAEHETRALPDASFKVDSSSLGDDEMDFAKAMGFSGDAPAPKPAPASRSASDQPSVESARPETDPETESEAESAPGAATDTRDALPVEPTPDDVSADVPEPEPGPERRGEEARDETRAAAAPEASGHDWEDIHPRPAADGDQATLQARADQILADPGGASADGSKGDVDGPRPEAPGAAQRELAKLSDRLADRELELTRLREAFEAEVARQGSEGKDLDGLQSEMSTLCDERDQLIDQLSLAHDHLAESESKREQLAASLRAARGALIPLPEGERAMRAELLGLRSRLDEVGQENVRLSAELASVATELSIATARVEDRQHEIDHHVDRAGELEAQLAARDVQVEEAMGKHRELLELSTRLQAENSELRSTQAALEETLQARDLEIAAREEQLRVTREGLAARDDQLAELADRLDTERRSASSLEATIARDRLERDGLLAKIERRETRIARLCETLARIEDAMGRPIPTASDPDETSRRPQHD